MEMRNGQSGESINMNKQGNSEGFIPEREGTQKVEGTKKGDRGETELKESLKEAQQQIEEMEKYIKQLEDKVKKLENLAKVSNERYLQLQKELEFVREKHRSELIERDKYGIEKFAKDLLEVLDNFERALKHMAEMQGCKDAYVGVEMIYKQLKKVFEKHGITEIVTEKFDHHLCEAVGTMATDEVEENTILEVVQKGYKLHDKVLRPAKVIVAVPKNEEIT